MPNSVADLQIRASLIDDYLYVQDQPIVPAPGRFIAVQDTSGPAPVTHLFSLDSNGNLLHFRPDPTSHSGWAISQVPLNIIIFPVAAISAVFYGGVLDLLVCITQRAATLYRWTPAGGWGDANIESGILDTGQNNLTPDRVGLFIDAKGVRYVYAVGEPEPPVSRPQFALGCYDETADLWRYVDNSFGIPNVPLSSYWMEETEDGRLGVLSCDGSSLVSVCLYAITGAGGGSPSIYLSNAYDVDFGIGSISVPQVISLPGQSGANSLLLINSAGQLLLTNGYSKNFTTLTGSANAPGAVSYVTTQLYAAPAGKKTADSNLAIFALEQETQRLWVCRQNGMQAPGVPSFGNWVSLGDKLEAITCALFVAGAPEVFTVGLDMNVYRMAQDANDTIWSKRKIAGPSAPAGPPQNIAAQMMNIQALDAQKSPVGGALLSIAATSPVTLIANGLSYLVEPVAPAIVPMDRTGSVSVYHEAVSLSPPRLSFSIQNEDKTVAQRWCEGDVVEVKQGETALPPPPGSVAEKLANVTQTELVQNNLMSADYSDPAAAAQSINKLGSWMVTQNSAAGIAKASQSNAAQAWRLEFEGRSGIRFRALTPGEATSYFTAGAGAPPGSFFSGLWGDVVNGVKHFWDDVRSITTQVVSDGIQFAIDLGSQVVHFVVKTAREAGAALEIVVFAI